MMWCWSRKFWNSADVTNYGPLSNTTICGNPKVENISRKRLMVLLTVVVEVTFTSGHLLKTSTIAPTNDDYFIHHYQHELTVSHAPFGSCHGCYPTGFGMAIIVLQGSQ